MKGLKGKDILKMDAKERASKMKELRMELVKSKVAGKSSKIRTKEIKKAIARLLTVTSASRKSPSVTTQ